MTARIIRQIEVERKSIDISAAAYVTGQRKLKASGHGSSSDIGRDFVTSIVEPLTERIITEIAERGRGRITLATKFIASLPPMTLAYIAARHLIDGALSGDLVAKRASLLGDDLIDQVNAIKLQEHESGAYEAMIRRMNRAPSEHLRKTVCKAFTARWYKDQIDPVDLSAADRVKAGLIMLHLASLSAAQWVEKVPHRSAGKKHTAHRLQITPTFMEEMSKREELRSLFSPQFPIFLSPPRDWTSVFSGCYYTPELNKRCKLIRSWNYDYLREINDRVSEFPQMLAGINAAQKTAWRINTNILDVIEECLRLGGGDKWALPIIDKHQLPKLKGLSPNSHEFKRAQKIRCELISRNIQMQGIVNAARTHTEEPEIYFGYAVDTRGRGYPVYGGRYLSPHGCDLAKGLLEYSTGEAIGGQEGVDWLFYGAANAYGVDKVSRAERIKWGEDNSELMAAIANDPYRSEHRAFWTAADSPWQFLAFCFEVRGLLQDYGQHITRINVAQDGCQNALQHVAAMLRDSDLAMRCSVINDGSGCPRDLYQDVADTANAIIATNAQTDPRPTSELVALGEEIRKKILDKERTDSNKWIPRLGEVDRALMPRLLAGAVDRSMTKRPVMTCTYDVSNFTRKEQISDAIIKNMSKYGEAYPIHDGLRWRAAMYLEPVIFAATLQTIPAAFRYLDWLKEVANLVTAHPDCSTCPTCGKAQCKCECPLPSSLARKKQHVTCRCHTGVSGMEWITPLGFPVLHRKYNRDVMRIDTVIGSHRLQTSFSIDTGRIDRVKMRQGVAANFTHSYDAAMLWDVAARMRGAPLALVHDSFGTLPTQSTRLAKELRESFVRLYSYNRLEQFRANAIAQLRRNGREDLTSVVPPLPDMGDLHIEDALQSEYIFS